MWLMSCCSRTSKRCLLWSPCCQLSFTEMRSSASLSTPPDIYEKHDARVLRAVQREDPPTESVNKEMNVVEVYHPIYLNFSLFLFVFLSTENVQSRPVKIASWRVPADSPFLKFTLVVTRGEFGALIWHPEHLRLSNFSWWMLRSAYKHTRAYTHMHARSPVAVCYSSWLLANGLEKKNE